MTKVNVPGHNCGFSTGINGEITAGTGKLDSWGYWEFPCTECQERAESMICEGHESTNGPIGNTVYCDGTCKSQKVSHG